MYYSQLTYKIRKKDDRKRAVDNLIRLRAQLDRTVPNKDADDNLLLATFNIRDLGKNNRRVLVPDFPDIIGAFGAALAACISA
ncbi:MAG: hypothetical protein ACL93V_10985 [Candidatus Electrothrix sp. YB6]